ncbi:MAG: hypothetical protein RLZZ196_697 [Bacteroidota bacterium]|jgi:hypothetical protein
MMNDKVFDMAESVMVQYAGSEEWVFTGDELKKFAELLIRECADIATMNQFQWDSVGEYVLKHFGIK